MALPLVHRLGIADCRRIEALVEDLLDSRLDPAHGELYEHSWELVPELPAGLRKALYEFRSAESPAAFLIQGLRLDDQVLGEPPATGFPAPPPWRTHHEELLLALVSMGLGEPFARAGRQGARVIGDLLPKQLAAAWGTADGPGPGRADYVGLLAPRGAGPVRIDIAAVGDVPLTEGNRAVLRQPRFSCAEPADGADVGALLCGGRTAPYLRIDPFRARAPAGDGAAGAALRALLDGLDACRRTVTLEPGSVLVIDNHQAVHDLRRHPGEWLKQILVARDLRRLREQRPSTGTRVLDSDGHP
ncbi:Fe(II)-2OG oxygenase family protein [Streptacidiphilus sp. PAMC 29251]